MQSRTAFNGGEYSPEMGARQDLDHYARGCDTLVNWNVSQTGGISRRRGLRNFALASSENVKIVPYIYTYSDDPEGNLRFLVEVSGRSVRVLSLVEKDDFGNAIEVARFNSGSTSVSGEERLNFSFTPHDIRHLQINKLLVITSPDNSPFVLKYDGEKFEFESWKFKHRAYRFGHEEQEKPIKLTIKDDEVDVDFSRVDEKDKPTGELDYLRASFWIEQAEATAYAHQMQADVEVVTEVPATASAGDKFVVLNKEPDIKYYVANETWNYSTYVEGYESPSNYTNFKEVFEITDHIKEVATECYSVKELTSGVTAKHYVALKSAYWDYWYCYKDFTKPTGGSDSFEDYTDSFFHGLPLGDALPCQSGWSLYTSGVWYGKYNVYRNYETSEINDTWEMRGSIFSRNFAASNVMPTGNENEEECYLRAFIEKSRCLNESNFHEGFPADACGIRLIVNSYKHDEELRCEPLSEGSETLVWRSFSKVKVSTDLVQEVYDWSWQAFSSRYGFPRHAFFMGQRLGFASTGEQPQTIWMSRVDDYTNFLSGATDSASIWLTMATPSQNPICWLKEQSNRLYIGTAEAEYVVSAGGGNALTPSNAVLTKRSFIGSALRDAVLAIDRILFVERGSFRVYEFAYNFEMDGYIPKDLSIFSAHLGKEHGGFKSAALVEKPEAVAMFVLGDGQLALCTYNSLQQVNAWHRWRTDGKFMDVCAMPNGEREDSAFFVVARDGKAYIEAVDEQSEYQDENALENDYASTLVTNNMDSFMGQLVKKQNASALRIRFGSDFVYDGANMILSKDAFTSNYKPDKFFPKTFHATWYDFVAPSEWQYETKIGISVTGNTPCSILAIQG